jgi:MFS family permease
MKTLAGGIGAVLVWSTFLYIVIETVRARSPNAPRSRYWIYGGLFLGSPFVGAPIGAWVTSELVNDSSIAIAIGATLPVVICWGIAIRLLLKWPKEDAKREPDA